MRSGASQFYLCTRGSSNEAIPICWTMEEIKDRGRVHRAAYKCCDSSFYSCISYCIPFEMSSEKTPGKESKRSGFSIIAVVKKKKKRKSVDVDKTVPLESAIAGEGGTSEAVDFTEIYLERPRAQTFKMANDAQAKLQKELDAAREEVSSLQSTAERDKETIAILEERVREAETEVRRWEGKVAEYEKVSGDLDDDSFGAAQEFQLKKEIKVLQTELDKRKALEQELQDAKVELTELRSENEELQLNQQRSTTRSKIKSISDEKGTRDELLKLQKEVRQLERSRTKETALFEAQLKAAQDSIERAQDKTRGVQRRFDEVDKERSQLKIELKRLERKLEKAGSYAERKRHQMAAESHELEISNLRRKNAKLEKRLSFSQSEGLNFLGLGSDFGDYSVTSSAVPSGRNSPIPETVGETRIYNLEKDVARLEFEASKLEQENMDLHDKLATSKQNEELLSVRVKLIEQQLDEEKQEFEQVQVKLEEKTTVPAGSLDEYVEELQSKLKGLEKMLQDKETEFRVKEKDLWATIEELKRKVNDLEMEKLRVELGEDEGDQGEEELTDVEDEAEVNDLRKHLSSLQTELDTVKGHNEELQGGVEKQMQEAEEFMKALESIQIELDSVKNQNEELQVAVARSKRETEEGSTKSVEMNAMRTQLNSLQTELDMVKTQKEELQADAERQKQQAEEFMKSLESELDQVNSELDMVKSQKEELQADAERQKQQAEEFMRSLESELDQVNSAEDMLARDNDELKQKLQEERRKYEECIREIASLKEIIEDQDNELATYDENQEIEHQKLIALQRELAEREQQRDRTKQKENEVSISNDTAGDVTAADTEKQQKVKKIQGTGGVQLFVGAKKSQPKNLSAMTQVTRPPPEDGDSQLAPSLTSKFKKPPPALKKKPSKEFRQRAASNAES